MDLNTILQTCFTKQEALRKLEELKEEWNKNNFDGRKWNIEDSTLKVESGKWNKKNNLSSTINLQNSTIHSLSSIVKNFDKTESEIKKMEPLIIFTAIPLPKEQIPILGNFVRKTFPKIFFIDLKVDSTLIGGASLGWKGELKDYSLGNKIRSTKS